MTIDSPLNTHFRRSQTPESPRPVHIPEPSNIPVLRHQMDPVFNDTATYDIPPNTDLASPPAHSAVPQTFPKTALSMYEPVSGFEPDETVASQADGTRADTFLSSGSASMANVAGVEQSPTAGASSNALFHGQLHNVSDAHDTSQPTLQPNNPSQSENTLESSKSNGLPYLSGTQIEAPKIQPVETGEPMSHANLSTDPPNEDGDDGVNFQTLLDNLSRSTSTAPPADSITAPTTVASQEDIGIAQSAIDKPLPLAAGLPPRPPPQEKPAMHPNYSPNEDIQSYHQMPPQPTNPPSYQAPSAPSGSQNSHSISAPLPAIMIPSGAPGTTPGSALQPPPSLSTYQNTPQTPVTQPSPTVRNAQSGGIEDSEKDEEEDVRWGPEIQKKYDFFLHEERRYVTEGVWDRFPPGSRLFVGNLPTEKVTKRDLFHIFHKHGKLAQISIKQAYGFVQFLDATSCYEALEREQSVAIRGRKIHLEVSKPQKNTRNSGPAEHGKHEKHEKRRRSRSPGKRGGGRRGNDRSQGDRLPFSDFRDEPNRRRDDYRPPRSPSPRGAAIRDYRMREASNDRYGPWDGRRGSPTYGRNEGRFASPVTRSRGYEDNDPEYLIPRRRPEDVPDVQILVLEEVDRNFVFFIENGFRSKQLRCDVLMLSPRLTLQAVIKRQVLEGVQAVVKLNRLTQVSGKIPIQVFDRSSGAENVSFNEYEGLDVSTAADLVIHARQTQRVPPPASFGYAPPQNYRAPAPPQGPAAPHAYSHPPDPAAGQPNVATMFPNLDSTSLQKLLGALQQPQGHQTTANLPQPSALSPVNGNPADLASLLSNVARQQQSAGYQASPTPQQPSNGYAYNSQPTPQSYAGGYPPQGGQPNVQSIMDQLSRYK